MNVLAMLLQHRQEDDQRVRDLDHEKEMEWMLSHSQPRFQRLAQSNRQFLNDTRSATQFAAHK